MNQTTKYMLFGVAVAILLGILWYSNSTKAPETKEAVKTQTTTSEKSSNNQNINNNQTQTTMPSNIKQYSNPPAMTIDKTKKYFATVETSKGTMKFELFASETPVAVNNFVFLSKDGFYSGVKFHRIIKGFMVQSGDPKGNGTGDPGYKFKDEPITRDYKRGTLAMANSGANTNGSQFFIMHADYALPKNYVIFGQLVDGLDTLDKIAETPVTTSPTGEKSLPTENVTINSVSIEEK
jgi:cyclophilin family peptidyl-prolyl cis-trans isomerase